MLQHPGLKNSFTTGAYRCKWSHANIILVAIQHVHSDTLADCGIARIANNASIVYYKFATVTKTRKQDFYGTPNSHVHSLIE